MSHHNIYIYRCLQLAQLAKGNVFPNPLVGAVIVKNNKIIGEGLHQKYGGAHAEVNAINSVKNREVLIDSTLYVNLEPCCHWGKTAPCTQLIIESGIKNVIIGNKDPNPLINGKGVKDLELAGIKVVSGILEYKCTQLNYQFFKQFEDQNSIKYVLKWAQSADGFMGKSKYNFPEERELSNDLVRRYVHKLRSQTDAILIGTNTALTDNPILDNRFWYGKLPTAIILDKDLKIPLSFNIFKPERDVIIINNVKNKKIENRVYCKVDFDNEVDFWKNTNEKLLKLGISSVLIEGGSKTIQSFLDSSFKSDIIRITAPINWEVGIKAPSINIKRSDYFILDDNLIEMFSA